MRSLPHAFLLAALLAAPSRGDDGPSPLAAPTAVPAVPTTTGSPSAAAPAGTAEVPRDAAHAKLAVVSARIQVTATLRPEERADVPATVRVVTGDEARARDAELVSELLATVAGAQALTLGAPGQQSSLFVRGADSNQTLVLWNGIPLNDPFLGGFNFGFLGADAVGRVEVVPGPFSALYGSSAMGGVVQVLTEAAPGIRLQLEAGQRDQRRVQADAAAARGPFDGWVSGHWRTGNGGLGNDAYDSSELAGRVGATGAHGELSLLVRGNDSSTGIPFDGFTPSPHRSIDWRESEWALPGSASGDGWDVTGALSQLRSTNRFDDPDLPFHEDTDGRVDRARAVGTLRGLALGWWAAGAEWERQTVTDRSDFGTSLDGARQRTVGVFTQAHASWSRVSVDLGVRHDDNDVFGGATSPRLGVVVAVTDAVRLRGSYGESFRAPALGELFYPFLGNPALRPERGRSAELGAQASRGAWTFDAALFDSRQRDLIDYDFAAGQDVNVGRARSRGVDAELAYRQPRLEVRLGGMRLHAEDLDSGEPLRNRPESSAHLVATARPGRAELSLVTTYVGPRVNAYPVFPYGDTRVGGYATVDVAAGVTLAHALHPYLHVTNLLDRATQPVLGFPAPGRTVAGGVRTSW